VCKLVGQHRVALVVVERLQQRGRDHDGAALRRPTAKAFGRSVRATAATSGFGTSVWAASRVTAAWSSGYSSAETRRPPTERTTVRGPVPVLHRQPAEHDDREDDGVDVELPGVGALARPPQRGSPMVLIRKTNVYANANGRAITSPVATAIRIRSHCC